GESMRGLASSLAAGVTVNDLDYLKQYLPRVMAVTPADVQRVAKKYLDPEKRVTVWSVPTARKPEAPATGVSKPEAPARRPSRTDVSRPDAGTAEPFSLKKAQRVVLPNGLVLLLFENRRLPIFYARYAVKDVALLEPEDKLGVSALTGYLLDEGTKKR